MLLELVNDYNGFNPVIPLIIQTTYNKGLEHNVNPYTNNKLIKITIQKYNSVQKSHTILTVFCLTH